MKSSITISPTSDFAGNEDSERKAAEGLSFSPIPPITVESYTIEEMEAFSGRAVMELSNGHTLEYDCIEVAGYCGADCRSVITLTDAYGVKYTKEFDSDDYDELLTHDTIAACMFNQYKEMYEQHFVKGD